MTENTCSNQNSILDTLRAIPAGKEVRFTLRRPDGSEFTHVSAIDLTRPGYPDGFDMRNKEVALATCLPWPSDVSERWVTWDEVLEYVCSIVAIEQQRHTLPDLETLRKWHSEGATVRIEYDNDSQTASYIGPSPVTCKLLGVGDGSFSGLTVSVGSDVVGDWNLFLDPAKGMIGSCRPLVTSITKVADAPARELPQTTEEIDNLMQRAAREGTQVEVKTSTYTRCGVVHDDGSHYMRYLVDGMWLGTDSADPDFRIAAVKLLPREEKRPVVQHYDPGKVTFSIDGGPFTSLGFSGPFSLSTGPTMTIKVPEQTHITVLSLADVFPHIGRRVRMEDDVEGILTGCGMLAGCPGDYWFGLDGENPDNEENGCYAFSDGEEPWSFDLLPDEPAPSANLMIAPTCPADLEPYIGRRVRVLAGEERELVREGTLTAVVACGYFSLSLDIAGCEGWYYGIGAGRSTLVEILPELPDEPDSDDLEDPSGYDDAVSTGYFVEDDHLCRPSAVVTLNTRPSLTELLAMAPSPEPHGMAYAAYHHTLREAMARGLVST